MFECVGDRWTPGIGDPTIGGWLTVLAYVISAGLAFVRARDAYAALTPEGGALKQFWLFLSILLALMAINKQLDLQSALTAFGRCLSFAEGWYGERRHVQMLFVTGVALAGGFVMFVIFWLMRRYLQTQWPVLLGLSLLVTFVVVRAASFHHVDMLINTRLLGLKLNWVLEIGALAMMIWGMARGRNAPDP